VEEREFGKNKINKINRPWGRETRRKEGREKNKPS
jgi:hypothetical protein